MKSCLQIIGVAGILLLFTCADLERDNILDPKNPDSHRPRIVLIEAFVSADPDANYCGFALDALEDLEVEFGSSQLIILEYHLRNTVWQDEYASQDANVRYAELAASPQGIPDVFFNGADVRVQGAYSAETAYMRYRPAYESESNEPGLYTIEAQVRSGSEVTEVEVSLARLGNTEVANISIHAVVVHDMVASRARHVVRSVLVPKTINRLAAGEKTIHTFAIASSLAEVNNAALVLFIYDDNASNKKVLQALRMNLS